jgi:hypothetical protein
MKNLRKSFTSGLIALTLMTGAVAVPSNNANAAVIIGVGVPGIGSALVGLGMFMFSVTFGVSMNIHPAIIGAICVLDKDLDQSNLEKIKVQLVREFGLSDNLVEVIQDYMKANAASNQVVNNSDGSKSIVLHPEQIADVMAKANDAGMSQADASKLQTLLTYVPSESELSQIRESIASSAN